MQNSSTAPADSKLTDLFVLSDEQILDIRPEVDAAAVTRAQKFLRVASVQNRFSVGYRQWEAVLEYCEREEIAFIASVPLDAGDLAKHGVLQFLRRALGRAPRRHEGIDRVARRHGATASQIALAWLLHRSPLMLPIPGTASCVHLEENAAAASIQLTPDDLAELQP